jgi:hypothetical protein
MMVLAFPRTVLCFGLAVGLTGCKSDEEKSPLPSSDPKTEMTGSADEEGGPPEPELDCSAEIESLATSGCGHVELDCGSVITARMGEGDSTFSDDFYENMHCIPVASGYGGADAVYSLQVPASTEAVIRLESPCAELHLASFRWEDRTSCPSAEGTAHACEMDARSDSPVIKITSIRPERNLIIVDGVGGLDSVYRLSVTCNGDYR